MVTPDTLVRLLLQHGSHIPMRHIRTDSSFKQNTALPCLTFHRPTTTTTRLADAMFFHLVARPTDAHGQ
jgi:hypothetical protein